MLFAISPKVLSCRPFTVFSGISDLGLEFMKPRWDSENDPKGLDGDLYGGVFSVAKCLLHSRP